MTAKTITISLSYDDLAKIRRGLTWVGYYSDGEQRAEVMALELRLTEIVGRALYDGALDHPKPLAEIRP